MEALIKAMRDVWRIAGGVATNNNGDYEAAKETTFIAQSLDTKCYNCGGRGHKK